MDLRDWMKQNSVTQEAFGLLMDPPISQAKVSHWLQGTRRVSLAESLQVERITNGAVTGADLVRLYRAGVAAEEVANAG